MDGLDYDDNGYRLLSIKKVTAKKEHICADCKEKIMPGTRYTRSNFLCEGVFYSESTHSHSQECLIGRIWD